MSTSYEFNLPIFVDSTMLTAYRACPKSFFYEYGYGLRPKGKNIHLHAGGCAATAIEAVREGFYNLNLSPEEALKRAWRVYIEAWGDYDDFLGEKKSVFGTWRAICSYFEQWPIETDHIKPYTRADSGHGTFEYSFAIPMPINHPSGQPFIFCGRVDMLGEYVGKPCIVDEKLVGGLGYAFADKWRMRGQFLGYLWALRESGIPVDTAVIRGTAPAVKDVKHMEVIQPYSNKFIDRWYEETLVTLSNITRSVEESRWPMDFGQTCEQFGGCPFTLLCTAPGKDTTWFPEYKVERWNPLSRNPLDQALDQISIADLIKPTFEEPSA